MSPAETSPARESRQVSTRSPYAVGLVALMALGSVAMWIGLPIGLVFIASRLADSAQPSMGPYLLIIFGLPAGMAAIGKGLAVLDRHYGRVTATAQTTPQRATWLKSMRGERGPTRKRTVLDTVMVWSVSLCLLAMGVWFFGFAGSSLPGGA